MVDGDPVMIRAFLDAYGGERIDRAWREQMFAWTLVYRFGRDCGVGPEAEGSA